MSKTDPFSVHVGVDYVALLGPGDDTSAPTAMLGTANDGTAHKIARLLNTFPTNPKKCDHFYVTDHTGHAELCTKCAAVRA